MKIGLVCPASLPATQFGGIMFLCLDLAREFSENNHDVKIYTTDMDFSNGSHKFSKALPRIEKIDNFKIFRSHVWFSIKLFFVNPGIYKQMINDEQDIIHTIGIRSFQSLIAVFIAKKKKIPLIISDQGGLFTHPDYTNGGFITKLLYFFQKPLINYIINNSTKIIVANEYEKKIFSKFNASKKCHIIKNGINLHKMDDGQINFKEKYNITEKYFLFLGRFNKVKGIDTLLESINIIQHNELMKNTKLVLMGVDFGFENEMEKIISDLRLNDKILIIKNPKREEVVSAYKQCEFLILPSRWELSPLTPLDGFAFKKTVISTTAHGIPYTISNNENSLLVEPENPTQLADAILKLLNDDLLLEKLGNSGFEHVLNVANSKKMAENTINLYQNLSYVDN
jgi:glycosyltransferase involved in cell wall biosynthesis